MQIIIDPDYDIAQNLNLQLVYYFKKGCMIVGSSNIEEIYTPKYNEGWFGLDLDVIVINGEQIKYPSNTNVWVGGLNHRINGPSFIDYEFKKEHWMIEGKHHRDNGPAVVDNRHREYEWYNNGERYSKEKELLLNIWWRTKNGL
jgi:hypothetical protein